MPIINSRFFCFLLCVALITGCNRCKEECDDPTNPECPNYCPPVVDQCEGLSPVSASFTISARASTAGEGYNKIIEAEGRVIAGALVIIHAMEDDAAYKWILGADTIYGQDYEFTFSDAFIGQTISIKLIVNKTPNTICFPTDNGMDTITQYVQVIVGCNATYQGVYYGAWDEAPLDSFYVSFKLKDSPFPQAPDCSALWTRGANGDFNDSCRTEYEGGTDNYLWIGQEEYCATEIGLNDPNGHFFFDNTNGRIHADYELKYWDGNETIWFQHKIFNGRKIQ